MQWCKLLEYFLCDLGRNKLVNMLEKFLHNFWLVFKMFSDGYKAICNTELAVYIMITYFILYSYLHRTIKLSLFWNLWIF